MHTRITKLVRVAMQTRITKLVRVAMQTRITKLVRVAMHTRITKLAPHTPHHELLLDTGPECGAAAVPHADYSGTIGGCSAVGGLGRHQLLEVRG